jgi:hypothetical protein
MTGASNPTGKSPTSSTPGNGTGEQPGVTLPSSPDDPNASPSPTTGGGEGTPSTGSGPDANPTDSPNPAANPPPPPAGITECKDPSLIGPTPIRRISTDEYVNAVRDVFNVGVEIGQLPADEKLGIFRTNVVTRVTDDNFERYRGVAKTAGADVVANFAAISGCTSTMDTSCVTTFLNGAARRLFHGTLEDADATLISDIYTTLAATDASVAVDTAVEWMLLSPRFLFMVEFGKNDSTTRSTLTGSEIAGRLAAFFWRTVPDNALLQAADSGALDTPEGVRSQADTMLSDARSLPMLQSFGLQLLRVTPATAGSDALEVQKSDQVGEIFAKASTDATLTYAGLITGDHPPSGSELQAFYGDEDRRGVLLTAGFLESNKNGMRPSPVKRGYVVRTALLCGTLQLPTDPTVMQLVDSAGSSDKEVFNAHSSNAQCWSCHKMMDPLGDAFGQYDATGGFDATLTQDTSGSFNPDDDTQASDFQDLSGFLTMLSQDPKATECFALQMTRFALGRNETENDACGVQDISKAFGDASYSVRELLLSIAASSTFTSRNAVVAGGECR